MIIKMLLDVLYSVFSVLTAPINIPQFPAEVQTAIDTMLGYISAGVGILANYTHLGYLLTLFGLVIAVDIGIMLYHFVMWILKKIPMLSIR